MNSNKTIVVTGATRGLGYGISKRFRSAGYDLVAIGRHRDGLENLRNDFRDSSANSKLLCLACDVTVERDVEEAAHQIKQWSNRVDVLVNNAGIRVEAGIELTSLEAWQSVIATNLTAPFLVVKTFLPLLRNSPDPVIFNISSTRGLCGASALSAYCSSKSGLIALTQAMSEELSPMGVAVYSICPGAINTGESTAALSKIPTDQLISTNQIAEVIHTITSSVPRPSVNTIVITGKQKHWRDIIAKGEQKEFIVWE